MFCFCHGTLRRKSNRSLLRRRLLSKAKDQELLPQGESIGFVEIQNEKLIVQVSPTSGKVWEARLKEHTYLNNEDSQGCEAVWF
jgi:hypothetical protein